MTVTGRRAVARVDLHHPAVAADPSRGHHFSVRSGAHRVAGRRPKIEAGVHRRAAEERIAADPEARREFNLADDRLAIWHQGKGPVPTLHLAAGDVAPAERPLATAAFPA